MWTNMYNMFLIAVRENFDSIRPETKFQLAPLYLSEIRNMCHMHENSSSKFELLSSV